MRVIEYKTGDFEFEFVPSANVPTKGELTTFVGGDAVGDTHVDAETDLKKPAKQAEYIAYARELYPEVFEDELGLKRALNELCGHVKDEVRIAEAKKAEDEEDDDGVDDAVPEEIRALVRSETILDDYVEAMAEVHEVAGDRHYMRLIALGALSAQLAPLPSGTVLGTNVILTADSGRGKNFLCDAVASGLPADWVYAFESASAKAFYYKAAANPECFKHTWAYPNEAEATDMLVETLRPLLSSGRATHDTVDSDGDGKNEARSLTIEGPITVVIPTIRNKLDGQLQTRMLVVDVADYVGRVQEHTAAFSRTLWASHAATNQATTLDNWRRALSTLTGVRRVVLPIKDTEFKLNADITHGARLWRNFCSLLLTNAWLQQNTREIVELANGESAVSVSAEDYRVAYEVFQRAATRSVDNIGEHHTKILEALYELKEKESGKLRKGGFSMQVIGEKIGCSRQAIRKQKTYLITTGLIHETDSGALNLSEGVKPSAWDKTQALRGFPTPEEIKERWGPPKAVVTVVNDNPEDVKPIDKPNSPEPTGLSDGLSKEGETTDMTTGEPDVTPEEKPVYKLTPNSNGRVTTTTTGSGAAKKYRKGETELGSYNTNSRGDG